MKSPKLTEKQQLPAYMNLFQQDQESLDDYFVERFLYGPSEKCAIFIFNNGTIQAHFKDSSLVLISLKDLSLAYFSSKSPDTPYIA